MTSADERTKGNKGRNGICLLLPFWENETAFPGSITILFQEISLKQENHTCQNALKSLLYGEILGKVGRDVRPVSKAS